MLVSIKLDVEVHLFLGEIIQLPLKGGVPTEWGQQHRHPRPASNHPAKEPLPAGKGGKKCMVSTLDTTQLLPVITV